MNLLLGEKCPCRDGLDLIQHTLTPFRNHTLLMSSDGRNETFSVTPLVDHGESCDERLRSNEINICGGFVFRQRPCQTLGLVAYLAPSGVGSPNPSHDVFAGVVRIPVGRVTQ